MESFPVWLPLSSSLELEVRVFETAISSLVVDHSVTEWQVSDLVTSRLPEEHRRWEREVNKYLQDVEPSAAFTAGVKRRHWLLGTRV